MSDTIERIPTWSASVGIPGIDALHSYASDSRDLSDEPLTEPSELPSRGPSYDPRAPIPYGEYWENRNASQKPGIVYSDVETGGDRQPTDYDARTRDPRNQPVIVDRWTAKTSPNMYEFERPFGQRFAKRFYSGAHSSMTTPPRFGPQAFGDGQGLHRARNTQRNIPDTLDQQIINKVDQPTEVNVLAQGSSLVRWW